jgi:DNA-binding transcriptional LysR family regulator
MHAMHVRDLELSHIRLLARLIETRNLSRAARQMDLSPSAASHALAKLRKLAGDPLFIASSGGLMPTPFGDRLGAAAKEALEVLTAGLAVEPRFDPRSATKRFSIYLSNVGQLTFLPTLMAFLQNEAPGLSIRAVTIPVESPGKALESGEIDLAVGVFDNLIGGFHETPLGREPYVCLVRADHPSFQSGMTMEAFLQVPHAIADSTGSAHHASLDRAMDRSKIKRHVKLIVPEFAALPMLLPDSNLLVIVPQRLAALLATHLPIKILPPPISIPPMNVAIYWHERYHRDPANQWLRQTFVKLFQGEWTEGAAHRSKRG